MMVVVRWLRIVPPSVGVVVTRRSDERHQESRDDAGCTADEAPHDDVGVGDEADDNPGDDPDDEADDATKEPVRPPPLSVKANVPSARRPRKRSMAVIRLCRSSVRQMAVLMPSSTR